MPPKSSHSSQSRRRRSGPGFTMLELVVSVGLMVALLGVLAFVFRMSAEAVDQATQAVNVVQKARNFEAKLGRELASAVQHQVEVAPEAAPERAFMFDDDPEVKSGQTSIEFVSRTLQDGVLDTWDVKYVYVPDPDAPADNPYGAIIRKKDAPKPADPEAPDAPPQYEVWDHLWDDAKDETLARPVKGVLFEAAGGWMPMVTDDAEVVQNPRLPAYVRVKIIFCDVSGGVNFELPMEFYFRIYQGN